MKIDPHPWDLYKKVYIPYNPAEQFKNLGLKPTDFSLHVAKPRSCEPTQKDVREWALLFPLYNNDKGKIIWEREEPLPTIVIDSLILDGTYIIRTDVPYTIDNRNSDDYYVIFSYKFDSISWDQIDNIL